MPRGGGLPTCFVYGTRSVIRHWGGGEMGEPRNLEGLGQFHLKQFLERITLKGRNSAGKRVRKSCFIWWGNLFRGWAYGDRLAAGASFAPTPYQLRAGGSHQWVRHGAKEGTAAAPCGNSLASSW